MLPLSGGLAQLGPQTASPAQTMKLQAPKRSESLFKILKLGGLPLTLALDPPPGHIIRILKRRPGDLSDSIETIAGKAPELGSTLDPPWFPVDPSGSD